MMKIAKSPRQLESADSVGETVVATDSGESGSETDATMGQDLQNNQMSPISHEQTDIENNIPPQVVQKGVKRKSPEPAKVAKKARKAAAPVKSVFDTDAEDSPMEAPKNVRKGGKEKKEPAKGRRKGPVPQLASEEMESDVSIEYSDPPAAPEHHVTDIENEIPGKVVQKGAKHPVAEPAKVGKRARKGADAPLVESPKAAAKIKNPRKIAMDKKQESTDVEMEAPRPKRAQSAIPETSKAAKDHNDNIREARAKTADPVQSNQTASPKKKTAKKAPATMKIKVPMPKTRKTNLPGLKMILEALEEFKSERKGISFRTIKSFIKTKFHYENETALKKAVKNGLLEHAFVKTSGIGLNGKFKLMSDYAKKKMAAELRNSMLENSDDDFEQEPPTTSKAPPTKAVKNMKTTKINKSRKSLKIASDKEPKVAKGKKENKAKKVAAKKSSDSTKTTKAKKTGKVTAAKKKVAAAQ